MASATLRAQPGMVLFAKRSQIETKYNKDLSWGESVYAIEVTLLALEWPPSGRPAIRR